MELIGITTTLERQIELERFIGCVVELVSEGSDVLLKGALRRVIPRRRVKKTLLGIQ